MSKLTEEQLARPVPSDIEISQALEGSLPHITEIAKACGILESEIEPYGRPKAKVNAIICGIYHVLGDEIQYVPVSRLDCLRMPTSLQHLFRRTLLHMELAPFPLFRINLITTVVNLQLNATTKID